MCVNFFGTINISLAALYVIKGVLQFIDLMSITQGDKRNISPVTESRLAGRV